MALVPSVPNLFIFTTTGVGQAQECVSDFREWNSTAKKGYFSAVFLVIFVIPLVSAVCSVCAAIKGSVDLKLNSPSIEVLRFDN